MKSCRRIQVVARVAVPDRRSRKHPGPLRRIFRKRDRDVAVQTERAGGAVLLGRAERDDDRVAHAQVSRDLLPRQLLQPDRRQARQVW